MSVFWTNERLREAFERHFWHDTMKDLAAELREVWSYPVTRASLTQALRKGFPSHNFRMTVGTKKKLAEMEEREELVRESQPGVSFRAPERGTEDRFDRYVPDVHAETKKPGDLVIPLVGEWTTVFHMPDGHFPYHDPYAHEAAMRFCEEIKPDYVIHTGDDFDLECLSFFDGASEHREKLHETFERGSQLWREKAARYRAAGVKKWIFMLGNHEVRMHKWILDNCPALYQTIPPLQEALQFDGSGWECVGYGRKVWVGHVQFKHGRRHNKHIAASEVEKHGTIAFGHVHRIQLQVRNTRPGYQEVACTPGFLGELRQKYQYHDDSDHVQGCAVWQIGAQGQSTALPLLIIDGQIRYPLPGGEVLVCDGRAA